MTSGLPARDTSVLATLRTILIWTFIAGAAGTIVELLLIGHDESAAQFVPLVLLATGIVVGLAIVIAPATTSVRALKWLMVLFLASGVLGVGLHYQGNEEFELERQPSASGLALVSKTLRGATPVLAPGSMSLLGAVGLAFVYRHPLLRADADALLSDEA
jgi:hypothetical protein